MGSSNVQDMYRLSPIQQGMLFHSLYGSASEVYVVQFSCEVRGPLEVGGFRRAWEQIIQRHPVLRSSFHWEGLENPVQVVHAEVALPLVEEDWRDLSAAEQHERLGELLQSDRQRGFSLEEAPLMRLFLIRAGAESYHFIWTHHHALLDGWSIGLLLKELFGYYDAYRQGADVRLSRPRPFRDYIAWLQKQDMVRAEAFWRETLGGFIAPTPIQPDSLAPAAPASEVPYGDEQVLLSEAATGRLQAFARQHQLTLNTLVQGAWSLLLSRYSGEEDIVFGATTAGRPAGLAGAEAMVGCFINTLPVRVRIGSDEHVVAWLKRLQGEQAEVRNFEYSPLVQVQGWSEVPRGVPLFESLLLFENFPVNAVAQELQLGLSILRANTTDRTNYPLTIVAAPGRELALKIQYDSSRFTGETVRRMLAHLTLTLESLAISPEAHVCDLKMLTESEREQVVVAWNATERVYPQGELLHDLIESQAARFPDRVAVAGSDPLTYGELSWRSNQVARRLQRLGVGDGRLVGICVERGPAMLVGLLGILKAGGAYVPLDPSYPAERLAYMIEDAGLHALLTQERLVEVLPQIGAPTLCLDREWVEFADEISEPVQRMASPESLAYVIYTSGSTGKPKGVAIPHSAVVNFLHAMQEELGVSDQDLMLAVTTLSFDIAGLELYLPLTVGGRVVIASRETATDGTQLGAFIQTSGATVMQATPATWRMLVDAGWPGQRGLTILSGGEALPPDLARQLLERGDSLWNLYGPTETTIWSMAQRVTGETEMGATVRVGRPIGNTQVYVLDNRMQPVPVGVAGEVYIGGSGVAVGYMGRPDLTAERFLQNPFRPERGERIYRTGDLGRFWPDGTLEHLGRIDQQVKLRGYRIELGEIEAVLRERPDIEQAVVTASADSRGEKRLVAYVVPSSGGAAAAHDLSHYLKGKLPEYMVPTDYLVLDALPLTPNGKVDRKALPVPGRPAPEAAYVAPRTPTEEQLSEVWAGVLGLERVGVEENFFDLGGHSLTATRTIAHVRRTFGMDVPLRLLFENPTVAAMAAAIDAQRAGEPGAAQPALVRADRGQAIPLSFAQRRLWFLEQLMPGNVAYLIPFAVRLTGELHIPVLERSLTEIVRRHETLRTTIGTADGQPVQRVLAPEPLNLACVDLAAIPTAEQEAEVRRLAEWEAQTPFSLTDEPLFRVSLVRLGAHEHVVYMTMHHIISDGWSVGVFIRELSALYAAFRAEQPSPLSELAIQYADFAAWQHRSLQGTELEQQITYWKEQIGAGPYTLDLPTDRPRPPVQTVRGASHGFVVSPATHEALRDLSRRQESTLFMTLLAAFNVLLHRYSSQDSIIVGAPVANRNRAELEGLIGLFVNTLALRTDLSGNPTFRSLLGRVRTATIGGLAHQDVPFEQVVEAVQPDRDLSRSPLFQVMFALHNTPGSSLALPGLEIQALESAGGIAKYDLTLTMEETERGLLGAMEYNCDLFDPSTVERMVAHLLTLLDGIVANPDCAMADMPLLTEEERHQILVTWNETHAACPESGTIHDLFEAQVERTPQAIAVRFEGQAVTFAELNERANGIAHRILQAGVGPGALVGINVERSISMVAGLIGILKSGAAYVPLDPHYPSARLALVMQDAGIKLLLTQSHLTTRIPATGVPMLCLDSGETGAVEINHAPGAKADDLAYVIYTSGSTGKPKGVQVTHGNVINFFVGMDQRVGATPGDKLVAVTSISFDISALELFWTLTRGCSVLLLSEQEVLGAVNPDLPTRTGNGMAFSLFYFDGSAQGAPEGRYRLLTEGAKFADTHGFTAVWTPERHFHPFGGLFPNPSVLGASLAMVTKCIKIRAGSVVMPLHHPLRVAEEWSVVDNLSQGRVELSFASGWHADDFALAPERYEKRKAFTYDGIEKVQRLWRGEQIAAVSGTGSPVMLEIFPKPVQSELPVWLTSSGGRDTFMRAGEIGANVLTHLLGQELDALAENIALYRRTLAQHGHDPKAGKVALMLHTFVSDDPDYGFKTVYKPFREYLRSSVDLLTRLLRSQKRDQELSNLTERDLEELLDFAFDRFYDRNALFGTPETCLAKVNHLRTLGVDEIACLIDFGVDADTVLANLPHLDKLRAVCEPSAEDYSLVGQVKRHGATLLQCTPSFMQLLATLPWALEALRPLRAVMLGGEALPPSLANQIKAALPARLINMYGPTETTVWSLTHELTEVETTVPIGRPIANTQAYVLDRHLGVVPVGAPGELHLGGRGVTKGYLNRPDLTAERFIPDPFSAVASARLYKTGDLVRYRRDGTLEFLGRMDHQVKVRGHRIELGEVEAALAAQPGVRQAVVTVREDTPHDQRLVAYLVADTAGGLSGAALRDSLRTHLPDYMVPSSYMFLDALPLTPNGKVDRKALPAPDHSVAATAYIAPSTQAEQKLADLWMDVLSLSKVGVHDDFFAIGGHSLTATQVISRVRSVFQVDLPLRLLFEQPTIAALAAAIDRLRLQGTALQVPPIVPVNRNGRLPLSFSQQRLWFLDQLEPGTDGYNIAFALRMNGGLQVGALEESFTELVRRQESLRTTFTTEDGAPRLVINPPRPIRILVVDLAQIAEEQREAEIQRLARLEAKQPFNLASGPLYRVTLLALSPTEHVLLVTLHHIISDGWSTGVILAELGALYQAFIASQPSPLPAPPVQYADFAAWQRKWLQGEVLEKQLAYWKHQLGGAPPALQLPTDRARPAMQTFSGASQAFAIPADIASALHALSRREGTSLFMTLLAAFKVLLFRYSGQEDITVGTFIANRNRAETEQLVGFFVNTLAFRTDLSGEPSFREVLRRVREVTLGGYAHQDVPFEQVLEVVQPERSLSRSPIFQVMFVLHNQPVGAMQLPGLTLSPMQGEHDTAKFDLTLSVEETAQGMVGALEYNTDLFNAGSISRLLRQFQRLLSDVVSAPERAIGQSTLLSEEELRQILGTSSGADDLQYEADSVHALIELQAERVPESPALVWEGQTITYRELNRRANQVAHYLRKLGVGQETVVGICVERSVEMVVGLLGILKAGGAYLPLDPAYPAERLTFMLADAGVSVLVTQRPLADSLPTHEAKLVCLDADWPEVGQQDDANPDNAVTADQLAYLIYTSGSTGRAKGVMVTHGNVVNAYYAWSRAYQLSDRDSHLQMASFSFDVFTGDMIRALASGAKLVLVPRDFLLAPKMLYELMLQEQVNVAEFVPAVLRNLVEYLQETQQRLNFMRLLVAGSDSWYVREYRELLGLCGPWTRLVNSFGVTEAAIDTTYFEASSGDLTREGLVPIGRPFPGMSAYVLDSRLQPVPVGVVGELFIGGRGVARGYWQRPDLTEERFLADPFALIGGAKMYRTGDLARLLPDGQIEFLGRGDHQVKIRGYRVELGEIEAVLTQHPLVSSAVVLARDGVAGKQLAAYFVGQGGNPVESSAVRDFLRDRLPEYMVPSAYVPLDAIPITPNGKVDRKALPEPETTGLAVAETYVAPSTPDEEQVAAIWGRVLSAERVGVHDNFFTLGGHSLLATQVISRVQKAFGVELPLRSLFETPTVAGMCLAIETARRANRRLAGAPAASGTLLSFSQLRLWFLDQFSPGAMYNIPFAAQLSGPLDVQAMERSLGEVFARHDILRTTFLMGEDEPVQVVGPATPTTLEKLSLEHLTGDDQQAEVHRLTADEAQQPFKLAEGPLVRCRLLKLAPEEHVLLLTMHHIVSDGWSMGVLLKEVVALYEAFAQGRPSPLPALAMQYTHYAAAQRKSLQGERLATQLAYWKEQLQGAPSLDLPTDRPRPAVQTFNGGTASFRVPSGVYENLTEFCRREGATPYMALLAAFNVLLSRFSGQTDIIVGSPIANRNQPEVEGLIGFFVNTLALRSDLSGNPPFRTLLERVKDRLLAAHTYQEVPFEQVVEVLQPERDLSRPPIFQVMFVLQNTPRTVLEMPGLQITQLNTSTGTAKFDLTLVMEQTDEALVGTLEYNSDLFESETAHRLLEHFQWILAGAVGAPDRSISELSASPEVELHQLLHEWNDTQADYPTHLCIHQLFEAQAERTPDSVALVWLGQRVTYRALNERANQVAHYIMRFGIQPDTLVGICMARSMDLIVGLLAILKAGGAYVPLDPNYPMDRIRFVMEDSQVSLLLSQEQVRQSLPEHQAHVVCLDTDWDTISQECLSNPAVPVAPSNLAYVIYTSGSTGRPKGALIEHHSAVTLIFWSASLFTQEERPGVLMSTSVCFDLSIWEMFVPLSIGGKMIVVENLLTLPGDPCAEEVTVINTVPSAAQALLRDQGFPRSVRMINLAGEALPRQLVDELYAHSPVEKVYNLYGPSEDTTYSTWALMSREPGATVTIGRPIAKKQIYLLDEHRQPVPIGAVGEIYIGGDGLARGYLKRPELTAERFVANPFGGQQSSRLYRTGDLARYLPDGSLLYLGRADHQIKVRGFRIEPGEIEAVLRRHPSVRETVVVARTFDPGDVRLVAYVVFREPVASGDVLRSYLREVLPEYMIPASFVQLEGLPLTPNGKVDRKALPAPEQGRRDDESFQPPCTPVERVIAAWVEEVLRVERVSVHDSFFELGGDSLLANQLISHIRLTYGVEIPMRIMFMDPTVIGVAAYVEQRYTPQAPQIQRVYRDAAEELMEQLNELTPEEIEALLAAAEQEADSH